MAVYFIGLSISVIFCSLAIRSKKKMQRSILAVLSSIPFICISAFRGLNVGIDTWLNYGITYLNAASINDFSSCFTFLLKKGYEVGFSFIEVVLTRFFPQPTAILLVGAICFVGFTFLAIYQQSKNPPLSIIILFLSGAFLLSMNGMRSYMAVAIVLYSLKFIEKREGHKYLLCIILAGLIHQSALIFLALYPLYTIKFRPSILLTLIGVCVLFLPFVRSLASVVLSGTAYAVYFSEAADANINPLFTMLVINVLLFALYSIRFIRVSGNPMFSFFLLLQALSVIICLFSFVIPFSFRAEQLIDFFQIISIPYYLNTFNWQKEEDRKDCIVITCLILCVFSFYFCKVFVLDDSNHVNTYESVFQTPFSIDHYHNNT